MSRNRNERPIFTDRNGKKIERAYPQSKTVYEPVDLPGPHLSGFDAFLKDMRSRKK